MPGREIPLVPGEVYHALNRGTGGQPIFENKRDYRRFFESMIYYTNSRPPLRFSKFLTLSVAERNLVLERLAKRSGLEVQLICYTLMPNHFHLVLRQITDTGIAKFIANLCNSYTRFFNTENNRIGPILQGKFKAVRVETDEQLLHVVRYVHLNPYTSYLVKSLSQLSLFPYSSLAEYLGLADNKIVQKDSVLELFKSVEDFKKFTFDQADYQRKLAQMRHLVLEG